VVLTSDLIGAWGTLHLLIELLLQKWHGRGATKRDLAVIHGGSLVAGNSSVAVDERRDQVLKLVSKVKMNTTRYHAAFSKFDSTARDALL
jgi:hypothetical protein